MDNAIEINSLSKSFGKVKAVDGLSFSVRTGELFAFLGVNGAGKSTTISIICGQLARDSGDVRICKRDIDDGLDEITAKLGIVFQGSVLDKALTVKDNLRSRAALYGITGALFKERLNYLTDLLELSDILSRPVGKLSGGQRRRADIARALINKPEVLILDEPTTGLDPQTRRLLWQVISDLRKSENMTVLLTTHYMEEASEADRVVIIDSGKKVAEGTPIELKNKYTGDFITLYEYDEGALENIGVMYEKVGTAVKLQVPNTAEATRLIIKHPEIFCDYEITKGKMDDVFLAVTGKKLTGGDEK